uniref:Uncharacterized protein n=1 Tax=Lepeophtheirus salmonis TaxID=72036 RepID=A0A0K2TLF7_LEPSM
MRVFEERFNVEPLSHSMNPEFLIHDGLMLLSVDSMLMKSAPKLRHEEGVHPIQKGVLFLLKGKLTLGEKATSGKGGVVQQGMIEDQCPCPCSES